MKSNRLLLCVAAVLTAGLASCTKNDAVPEVAQKDEYRYLRVSIADVNGLTKAVSDDEFETGDEDESRVGEIMMDFYDNAGNFIYHATESDMEDLATPPAGSLLEKVVKIAILKDQTYPSYVFCYVNPVSYDMTAGRSSDLNELRGKTRNRYKTSSNGMDYFAMNNSVYFGHDPVSGTVEGVKTKISGTPITDDKIFRSLDEAKAASAADKVVDIYVERYASKVKFSCNTDAATGDFDKENASGIYPMTVGEYTLTFVPQKWTVNAEAKEMYVVKKFLSPSANRADKAGDIVNASFDEVNSMLSGWNDWNDAGRYRCYWSCSPDFYSTNFPETSDNVIENRDPDGKSAYSLRYYSYNDIIAGTDVTGDVCGNDVSKDGNFKYVLENTVGEDALQSINPKAAVPSVLMVGKYKVEKDGVEIDLGAGKSFYKFGNNIYFEDANDGDLLLDVFYKDQKIVYVKDGDTFKLLSGDASKSLFAVGHPSKEVRNGKSVPMRFVTLQLSESANLEGLYFSPSGTGDSQYVTINEDNLEMVNRLLWQQTGVADAYYEGICYYSIPIRHIGFYRNDDVPVDADGKLEWNGLRVGDLGLVRNHVYDLKVKAINGLATGISDPKNPIVPPMEQDDYFIRYKINILDWRIVKPQDGIIL